mmetsp:Transcript_40663/g.92789  ORF Transcript_40663/g.92789 Transcript_40663/m.92789 type:complete len:117 (+) Transcript_40663:34-384(+)
MSQQPQMQQPQMYGTMPGMQMYGTMQGATPSQGPVSQPQGQMMYSMPGSMMHSQMMMQQQQQQQPMNTPPELPGDKLTPQECAAYGVPQGAVWGRVVANEGEGDMTADDDVRGTQV